MQANIHHQVLSDLFNRGLKITNGQRRRQTKFGRCLKDSTSLHRRAEAFGGEFLYVHAQFLQHARHLMHDTRPVVADQLQAE